MITVIRSSGNFGSRTQKALLSHPGSILATSTHPSLFLFPFWAELQFGLAAPQPSLAPHHLTLYLFFIFPFSFLHAYSILGIWSLLQSSLIWNYLDFLPLHQTFLIFWDMSIQDRILIDKSPAQKSRESVMVPGTMVQCNFYTVISWWSKQPSFLT